VLSPTLIFFVQCDVHLLTCQGETPMNNKAIYVLPERLQFIFVTVDLKIVEADF